MSPNVVIVIDNNDNVVYRISLNDCGLQSIYNNYDFLIKYNQELEIPKPISITYKDKSNIVVSRETKISNIELNTNTINATLVNKVFRQLKQFYEKNIDLSLSCIKSMINEYDYLYIHYHQNWVNKLLYFKNFIQ